MTEQTTRAEPGGPGQPDKMAEPEKRVRNRGQTERDILNAARSVLADEGFQNFGINVVARRAACDKQLIYRYFGGLEGLVDAVGESLADWVKVFVPLDSGGRFLLTYADVIGQLLELYANALRQDRLMQKVCIWELGDPSPYVRRLSEARFKGLQQWIETMRGGMAAPKGADAATINAALLGTVQHMVLSAAMGSQFSGVKVQTDKDWDKVMQAINRLVQGAYAGA